MSLRDYVLGENPLASSVAAALAWSQLRVRAELIWSWAGLGILSMAWIFTALATELARAGSELAPMSLCHMMIKWLMPLTCRLL